MLVTQNVSYTYPKANTAITFPDIQLQVGQDLLILGESGAGKTTLLHLIAGILKPQAGTIKLNGVEINQLPTRKLDQFRGKHIGIVFQHPHFVNSLSLEENCC